MKPLGNPDIQKKKIEIRAELVEGIETLEPMPVAPRLLVPSLL